MISFACARCKHKLQVPDTAAGKAVRCSLCKHVMAVAAPVAPAALATTLDLPQLIGQVSSLARAGLNGGITVGISDSTAPLKQLPSVPGQRSLHEILNHNDGERYQVAGEIARGGMGAVLRAVDCDIRREVAVKYLLDQSDPRKKVRFVEEAQITGQLEHPNIVPIHELGVDAQGHLFFSMKMVKGRSLQQVLQQLSQSPRTAEKEWPLGRLLAAFVNICHGLAYAHSRGVVHRDLKPANIMLGDFGEVYVMDWGLAKVLESRTAAVSVPRIETPPPDGMANTASAALSGTVRTNRLDSDEHTVDGTVMGTALYMPPEQASGQIAAIDQRSDVYSLGAVLYEILTLQPPIDRQGGFRTILQRVRQGEIIPPQERNPQRTRAGQVPKELAAVAMTALALKPEDRYPTVAALRSDIERFIEGRSVSVKEDSKRELLIKFVKRNKGFSLGAAAALLVLLCSSIFLLNSWLETRRAYAAFLQEQQAKRKQARKSVPAFVEAARLAVQRRKFDDALAQLNVAVDYAPDDAAARLLKGQLLAARKDFAAAAVELKHYVRIRPQDRRAARLAHVCAHSRPDDPGAIGELADILLLQNMPNLAEGLLDTPDRLLEVYRTKIDLTWPNLATRLTLNGDGKLTLNLSSQKQVLNLAPLSGLPLHDLCLSSLKIHDLTPLQDMPLTQLDLTNCYQITDLKPLEGLPLTQLILSGCKQLTDLSPLKGMPLTQLNIYNCRQLTSLGPLKGMPLTDLQMGYCNQIKDLTPLKGMPLKQLNLGECRQLTDLTPLKGMLLTDLQMNNCTQVKDLTPLRSMPLKQLYFSGSRQLTDLTPLRGMPLTSLTLECPPGIKDLTPLEGMPLNLLSIIGCPRLRDVALPRGLPLTGLDFSSCGGIEDLTPFAGKRLTKLSFSSCTIKDLTSLKGMRLKELSFSSCEVADLSPLKGMPLTKLIFTSCGPFADLLPLKGMPLTNLSLSGCKQITDLSPLKGLPLNYLSLSSCDRITDLSPLQGMPLTDLNLSNCKQLTELSALQGMPLTRLNLRGCDRIRDVTPLTGMKLTSLHIPVTDVTKGMDILRHMPSLTTINDIPMEDFWRKYDAGEFR